MVPCFLASPMWSSDSGSDRHAVFHTPLLGPWTPLCQLPVPGLSYSDTEYPGAAVPLPEVPCFYNPTTEQQSQEESRRFILDRSVFDLVEAHLCLSLTDSKLLTWYLSLTPDDRKIIRGEGGLRLFLQRHPALKLSGHLVYVNYSTGSSRPAQPTVTSQQFVKPGDKTSRCEKLEMFPSDYSLLGSRNTTGEHVCDELCLNKQPVHLQESFQLTSSGPVTSQRTSLQKAHQPSSGAAVCRDPSVLAGFSLDQEPDQDLDRCTQGSEIRKPISDTQGQNITCTSPSHSDWPTVNTEPSDFSSDRIRVDGSENSDVNIQTVDLQQTSNSPVGPEENTTKERKHLLQGDEFTDDDEGQTDKFHSIMEDDGSILVCSPSRPVPANSDTLKSDPPQNMNPSEEFTCPPSCDVTVNASTFTQTEDPETADKDIITEVHMADLDYLAEEFIKLKTTREQKEKMKRGRCDCTERAQKAELSLLALQYSIHRHHCWRLYFTSTEGNQLSSANKHPPANVTDVLEKLDSDYNEMKREILAGVPLEQLKPLSVDSEEIITGASHIPAQIIADVLGNVSSRTSEELQQLHTAEEQNTSPDNGSRNSSQVVQMKEKQVKEKIMKTRRAATLILKDRSPEHNKQDGKQTAVSEEFNRSELWFDAEEDLEPPEAGLSRAEPADEPVTEEAEGSTLNVSNLPSKVTESDVMLLLKDDQASEVMKEDQRVAMAMLSGPQSAEAAVKELNGGRLKAQTLHLEHISREAGVSRSQKSASASGKEAVQDTMERDSSRAEGKPPPVSSIRTRKMGFFSPTAEGTCVPQLYGTMGSFDALMSELLQRHPEVSRQRIMDALVELRTKHPGVLAGLPLQTIREMTSELLNRPVAASLM